MPNNQKQQPETAKPQASAPEEPNNQKQQPETAAVEGGSPSQDPTPETKQDEPVEQSEPLKAQTEPAEKSTLTKNEIRANAIKSVSGFLIFVTGVHDSDFREYLGKIGYEITSDLRQADTVYIIGASLETGLASLPRLNYDLMRENIWILGENYFPAIPYSEMVKFETGINFIRKK